MYGFGLRRQSDRRKHHAKLFKKIVVGRIVDHHSYGRIPQEKPRDLSWRPIEFLPEQNHGHPIGIRNLDLDAAAPRRGDGIYDEYRSLFADLRTLLRIDLRGRFIRCMHRIIVLMRSKPANAQNLFAKIRSTRQNEFKWFLNFNWKFSQSATYVCAPFPV